MNTSTDLSAAPLNKSLGIRGRLFIGFGAILFILIIAISFVLIKITVAENSAEKVINSDLPAYSTFLDLNGGIYESQAALSAFLLTHDPEFKTQFTRAINTIKRSVTDLDALSRGWETSYKSNWDASKSMINQMTEMESKMLADPDGAKTLKPLLTPLTNKLLEVLDGTINSDGTRVGGLYDVQYKYLASGTQDILNNMTLLRNIEYGLLFLITLVSVIISFFTTRSILRYVNIFRQHSNRLASGDLTQRISVQSNDEMGQLGHDLNAMTQSLYSITKQTTEACLNMVSMLGEVKHSVDVQSSGATEQASSINQITASLEEIEKSSTQTIDKAKMLGEVAERTREKGQLGLEAVEQSVNGMKSVRDKVQTIAQTILDLSNQTQQVGEITAVVNTLAQQSKMLALNASIEAAKAGEAGKGFAVVAVEVKNLAEQSEQSTAQVQKILEDIRRATEKAVMATEEGTKGVDQGTLLVEQTGDIVRSLSDVIHETTIASQQIEAAIRQEGIGIEQITAGMGEINQVTSSYVESVKQTNEAIDNLAVISKNLKEYIDVYKT